MDLYVGYLLPGITTLGPGQRIGLWVQGCSIDCPGCMSPELFNREDASRQSVSLVFSKILAWVPGHTGITVSGGEPFDQADGLGELLSLVRRLTTLDIMIYTGYSLERLQAGSSKVRGLLALVDILIDGQYRHDLPTCKLWRGSDNQVMHLLSPRVHKYSTYLHAEYSSTRTMQLLYSDDNTMNLIGIPERGDLNRFKKLMKLRGVGSE